MAKTHRKPDADHASRHQSQTDTAGERGDEKHMDRQPEPPHAGANRVDGRDVPPHGSEHDPNSPWLGGG